MKKPDFVSCYDCEHFYWYAGKCSAYNEPDPDEFDDCENEFWWSTMCPETIKWCTMFELKHTQEYEFEHYDHLPSVEVVKKMREHYIKMCDGVLKKIIAS